MSRLSHAHFAQIFAPGSSDDPFETLERELKQRGFGRYIYAQMHIGPDGTRTGYANRSTTEATMRAAYAAQQLFRTDPLIEHVTRSERPLLWSEAFSRQSLQKMDHSYRRFAGLASDYNLNAGVTLRLDQRPNGAGKLMSGISLMAPDGVTAAEHDRNFAARSPELAMLLVHFRAALDPSQVARDYYDLTSRELEMLRYVADGLQVQQVADKTGLAERTVAHHLGTARQKLFARTTTHAVATALRAGLL